MPPLLSLPEPILNILDSLSNTDRIWLVGGAIRDHFLNRVTDDFDFVVKDDAIKVARTAADRLGAKFFPLDEVRAIGRIIYDDTELGRITLDFAGMRGPDIEVDLVARDFSLNALAFEISGTNNLIDPTGGLKDLKDSLIRICTPGSIRDDPVRALRAVRLASELSFRIDSSTADETSKAASSLSKISGERIRDEVFRILCQRRPIAPIRVLDHLELIRPVFPELDQIRTVDDAPSDPTSKWRLTLARIDNLGKLLAVLGLVHDVEAAADSTLGQVSFRLGRFRQSLDDYLNRELGYGRILFSHLFLAALYMDSGKQDQIRGGERKAPLDAVDRVSSANLVYSAATRMRLSRPEQDYIARLVRHQLGREGLQQAPPATSRVIYRFYHEVGDAGISIILLALSDYLANSLGLPSQDEWSDHLDFARTMLEAYFEDYERVVDPETLVNGSELMEILAIPSGPTIGRLLQEIREAQAAGEVENRDDAISLAKHLVDQDEARSDELAGPLEE